jgi:ABC-type amino acid transport substrate-binding protein
LSILEKILGVSSNTQQIQPEHTKFLDVALFVFTFLVALFWLGVSNSCELLSDVRRDQAQLRRLKERDATLREQLAETTRAERLDEANDKVPHILPESLDNHFIGDHVTVSWQYSTVDVAKYTTYAIELQRVSPKNPCIAANSDDYLSCKNGPVVFTATDPINQTTRIPPIDDKRLEPGTYIWRVASVPLASTLAETDHLSSWSPYAIFDLYRSSDERVSLTNTMRVGTNLEQNTRFSHIDPSGAIVGFDIALLYAVVDGCLTNDREHRRIVFAEASCRAVAARPIEDLLKGHFPNQPCTRSAPTICVTLVPVRKWSDWETALRRREIDLFIGSVTRARGRQNGGIRFTSGYLPFNSDLYALPSNIPSEDASIRQWLHNRHRTIGVIDHSTNEILLDALMKEADAREASDTPRITKKAYASFPDLERALNESQVNAALIDETLVDDPRWKRIPGIREENAFQQTYTSFIGSSKEEAAMATIADRATGDASEGVYAAIQSALKEDLIKERLIPSLCQQFWPPHAARFRCPGPTQEKRTSEAQ